MKSCYESVTCVCFAQISFSDLFEINFNLFYRRVFFYLKNNWQYRKIGTEQKKIFNSKHNEIYE